MSFDSETSRSAPVAPRSERATVLIVGYSPTIRGGVTAVTAQLSKHLPETRLFSALKYYNPLWKQALYTLFAYCRFPVYVIGLRPRVVQILIGSRGDLVRNIYYIILSKVLLRKVVVQFHTNADAMTRHLPRALMYVVRVCFRFVDRFCFLSSRLRDEMSDLCGEARNAVIPNPVPDGYLEVSPLSRSERNGGIVFLGRWSAEKGVDELADAMRTLWEGEQLVCKCFGDTPNGKAPPGCSFGGWITGANKRDAIRKALLLVLPSHAEAYPITLLEAAACGTPFVATDVGGVRDIFRNSQGGILIDAGDVNAIVDAVYTLLYDSNRWQGCAEGARAWAESQSIAAISPIWQQFYRSIAPRRSWKYVFNIEGDE